MSKSHWLRCFLIGYFNQALKSDWFLCFNETFSLAEEKCDLEQKMELSVNKSHCWANQIAYINSDFNGWFGRKFAGLACKKYFAESNENLYWNLACEQALRRMKDKKRKVMKKRVKLNEMKWKWKVDKRGRRKSSLFFFLPSFSRKILYTR